MMRLVYRFVTILLAVIITAQPAFSHEKDADLVYKATLGRADDIALILHAGANPDAKNADGWPAISLTASRTDEEALKIAKLLAEAGANLNARNANGETPLMNAISSNNPYMVQYLISKGADFYAVSSKGQGMLDIAEWIGNPQVVTMIKEAQLLDQERIKEGKSRNRMYRLLDEYIYYQCAYGYLNYYRDSKQDPDMDMEKFNSKLTKVQDVSANASLELSQSFYMEADRLTKMAKETQNLITSELDNLISNRWRRQKGVGTDEDLDKRCKNILNRWRDSFSEYEIKKEQRLRASHRTQ